MTSSSVPGSLSHRSEAVDLDRVYREHAGTVSRWVRRLTGSNEASDVVQEVFEVAQRRLGDFRGDAQITTWLYSITIRVVSARRRKARLRRFLFMDARTHFELDARPAATPDDELAREHATRVVYGVLDRLSERDRTLLVLFELESLSTSEIASILGMTENNVSVSLHRARERFRVKLGRTFPEEGIR